MDSIRARIQDDLHHRRLCHNMRLIPALFAKRGTDGLAFSTPHQSSCDESSPLAGVVFATASSARTCVAAVADHQADLHTAKGKHGQSILSAQNFEIELDRLCRWDWLVKSPLPMTTEYDRLFASARQIYEDLTDAERRVWSWYEVAKRGLERVWEEMG